MFLKEFFEKVDFEKKSVDNKRFMKNYLACKELNCEYTQVDEHTYCLYLDTSTFQHTFSKP